MADHLSDIDAALGFVHDQIEWTDIAGPSEDRRQFRRIEVLLMKLKRLLAERGEA